MPDAVPSLRDLQRVVKAGIRAPSSSPSGAAGVLNPQRGTPGAERLAVYAQGYQTRIHQALAEAYPAIRHLLGERTFAKMAEAYAQRHPSRDYNLSKAGRHLPEFLVDWSATTTLPFLPDVATLERLVAHAFHAADMSARPLEALAALPPSAWDAVRLEFQPWVGVLASAWPVLDVWEARAQPRASINIALEDRPQHVVVFRRGFEVVCERLDPSAYALLHALLSGAALGDACAQGEPSNASSTIQAWFERWASQGWIAEWRES